MNRTFYRICSEIRQTPYKRVGRNFECKSRKRLLVRGFSLLLRAGIGVNALNVLNVHGRGQKVDNRVQKHLYALVFVGGTAQNFSAREVGASGICKGLRVDWNDCLNLGGGESAMVSFLHYWALQNFVELASCLGRGDDVRQYRECAARVKIACDRELWDGKWYIRGITKNGRKIGTKEDTEGKVHLESNTWAVLSGAAPKDKGIMAMDSVDEYLYTPYGLLLNAPSYTKPDDEIGFVTRVYPGLKENGAVFSHPNPWAWAAECKAMKFYNALCPYNQNGMIEIREAEPYSYCQFIIGKDHTGFGRARHPFMTGSGGWAYFAATRFILGVRPQMDFLEIDPCIPKEWESIPMISWCCCIIIW